MMSETEQAALVDSSVLAWGLAVSGPPANDVITIVHDLADRKMVAAALAAGGAAEGCEIVNACDTDWYEWESVLADAGLVVRQLIDAWCRARHESRRG